MLETLRATSQAAIQDYGEAIEINPQYAEAYYNRGFSSGRP